MKLSEKAIKAVNEDLNTRNRLAYELKKHIDTIQRWLDENKEDGDLTGISALTIISEETGLTQEEILEKVTV